ncbi:MAG: hypothetical protein K2W82_02570 [Candidatus Obscuribacterales bacterium]|nr:hypothetical protein [Candidatus Obscuribacterales bacterium]
MVIRFRKPKEVYLKEKMRHKNVSDNSLRRAVGLLPDAQTKNSPEIQDTVRVRFHHLLISLEGTERTGCLKIVSAKNKSRSAILLYKGQVFGCVYGRKDIPQQFLAQDAHKLALLDLAAPGNIVEAYELSEDMALATGALFNGSPIDLSLAHNPQESYASAIGSILKSGLPGCVVINNEKGETLSISYVASSKIIGICNTDEGWVQTTMSSTSHLFSKFANTTVFAAMLPPRDGNESFPYGFSLTGLGEKKNLSQQQLDAIDIATSLRPAQQEVSDMVHSSHRSPHRGRQSSAFATSLR